MEEVQANKDGQINLWQSAMIPKTGVFEWNDSLKTVVFRKYDSDVKADKFKSKFQDRTTHVKRERNDQEYQKRIHKLVLEMRSKAAGDRAAGIDPSTRPITFLDCKAVALNEMLVNRQPIPDTFLEFFLQTVSHAHCAHCQQLGPSSHIGHRDFESGPPFDQLIASLAVYFNYFFTKKDADEHTDGLHVSRSQAEEQMLIEVGMKMKDAAKQFGVVYNTMILGLGMDSLHHMNRGKCRVSTTLTDRQMFEALYNFAVEFIWVIFGRRDREVIKKEVGRLYRSDAFNRALRTTSTPPSKQQAEEPVPDPANIDPTKIVMSKTGKPLKDSQILSIIDRMGNKSYGASGSENDKVSPRSKKDSSAHGSMVPKSARTNTSTNLKGRSRSTDLDGTDDDLHPSVPKPLAHKKRGHVEPASPLTDEQILACIDRVANKYEQSIKQAAKEHFAQRAAMKRPPKKSLLEQRSVAAECVIPSVKPPGGDRAAVKSEEVNPFLKAPVRPESTNQNRFINVRKLVLGIIGQPLINYNSSSLIPLLNVANAQQGNGTAGATTVAAATSGSIVTAQPGVAESLRVRLIKPISLLKTLRFRSKNANVLAEAAQRLQTPVTRETTVAMDESDLGAESLF